MQDFGQTQMRFCAICGRYHEPGPCLLSTSPTGEHVKGRGGESAEWEARAYNQLALGFSIIGLVFILLGIVGGAVGIYVGTALVLIGVWQWRIARRKAKEAARGPIQSEAREPTSG